MHPLNAATKTKDLLPSSHAHSLLDHYKKESILAGKTTIRSFLFCLFFFIGREKFMFIYIHAYVMEFSQRLIFFTALISWEEPHKTCKRTDIAYIASPCMQAYFIFIFLSRAAVRTRFLSVKHAVLLKSNEEDHMHNTNHREWTTKQWA